MTQPTRRPRAIESPAAVDRPSAWAEWAPLALVLAAAAWLQRDVLGAAFFADDFLFLDQARAKSLWATLLSPDPIGNFMRPLGRQLHFWVWSRVGNESPVPFHAANIALLLVSLALFHRIARRVAGPVAALLAIAFLALHHVAGVPVLWASGSQDLIALTLALTALLLHMQGRRPWAAVAYGCALLAKETVLLTPVIACVLTAREVGSWRRSAAQLIPMALATALWGALLVVTGFFRATGAAVTHADPLAVPAALVHFVQSVFGLEWGSVGMSDGWHWPSLVALACVAGAVLWRTDAARSAAKAKPALSGSPRGGAAARRPKPPVARSAGMPDGLRVGLVWALCGALPVAAVAPIWSSYYYLYAMFGAALALGTLGSRLPRPATIAILVCFATLSARAAQREEFATLSGSWTTQSHVTPFYISRSAAIRGPLLDDLRSARPTLPHRSTIFFSSVPANIGWQVGDGPFVRWAYRDTSLRSYFLSQFSYARAHRGPVFFFNARAGHLSEMWRGDSSYTELAASLIIDDHPECSRDAIRLAMENGKANLFEKFLLAWLMFDQNQPDSAKALLAGIGMGGVGALHAPELKAAMQAVAHGDTLGAIGVLSEGIMRHPLDSAAHGFLADLLLSRDRMSSAGEVEAYASRVLAPEFPWGWRRWAEVQINGGRYRQAALSLGRYFALRGADAPDDPTARMWQKELQRRAPGGDLVQRGLRQFPGRQPPPPAGP